MAIKSKKERREARKAAVADQAKAYEENEQLHDSLEGEDEGEQAAPVKESSKKRDRLNFDGQVTVTKSYTRKLNMSMHGGKQYETLDLGETRTVTVEADEAQQAADQLYNDCKASVEENIRQFDNEMALFGGAQEQGDVTPAPRKPKKETSDIGFDREELKEIAPILNKLVAAKTIDQMKELGDEIQLMSELTKSQKDYLRTMYNKKAKELQNAK